VSEEELRREAVRRRQGGQSAEEVAKALGRTSRWVRKWAARAEAETTNLHWAEGRSRAPHSSPTRLADDLRQSILDARARLVANPRAQFGPLAVAWELRRMGIEPIPERWTIERVISSAGLARPRRRQPGYVPKGVPYPGPVDPEPGAVHQIDMVGPRHLDGAIEFHAVNLIDVGSHAADSTILTTPRPTWVAGAIASMWGALGVPAVGHSPGLVDLRPRGGYLPRPRRRSPLHSAARAVAQRGGGALQRRVGQELLSDRSLQWPRPSGQRELGLRHLSQ
jgi:transposase